MPTPPSVSCYLTTDKGFEKTIYLLVILKSGYFNLRF